MSAISDLTVVRALSRYRPFEGGGASVKEAHEDLILATLAEAGGGCESLSACRDAIQTLFRIDLSELLVAAAIKSLIECGRVVTKGADFVLADAEMSRLQGIATESQEIAEAALRDWRAMLVERWPLSATELDLMVGDLAIYLKTVLRRHGAEASMLLYPDRVEAQQLYAELEKEGFDFLPRIEDAHLREIRDYALTEFIRHPTEPQRAYLGQNLNTSYFLTMLSIDPEGARLVTDIATGQVVYVDTNFIYRLLGVQGPRYVRPAEEILRVTQEAGYFTRITPWTLDEFKTSLKRSRAFVERYPILPDRYAEIAATVTSNDNFVTEYWRRVRSGIKPADFFEYYDEVETHLKERNIHLSKEGCTAVDQQEELITDEMGVLARAAFGRYRHPALVEHDVKHRLLIDRLRGEGNRNFSNAGFWFLTHDSVLPRYDHLARESASALPFCVSAGAWYQIVEAFRPKTRDIDASLADMLASPYVRYRRSLSQKTAIEILARVNQFASGTPELATRVLMNSAAVVEIEAAETGDEALEKIDNAIIAAAKEAQEDARRSRELAEEEKTLALESAAAAEKRAEQAERDARVAEEVAGAAREDERERARIRADEEVRFANERAKREREEEQRQHRAELADKEAEVQNARTRAQAARRRLYFFSAVVGLVALFFLARAVAGTGPAWKLVGSIGVLLGIGVAIATWARWRSEENP